MKNSIKIISLIVLLIAAQSCTDLLERVEPSTATTQKVALGSAAGVKAVRAGMYTGLFSFAYNTAYMIAPSSLADGLYITPGSNRFNGKNQNTRGNQVGFWAASYLGAKDNDVASIIQNANLILGSVEKGVIPDALLKQYKGEAYFMRAFAFHNLARAYSYEPNQIPTVGQGAGWNKGIVIRTKPVLNAGDIEYKGRATVQETYQQIESDLLNSIKLLSQGDAGVPKYVTQAAAEALLARVYLYWASGAPSSPHWAQADQYATAALSHTSAKLSTSKDEVAALFFDPGSTTEVIFRAVIADFANGVFDPVNNGKAVYTSEQWMAQAPTQDQIDLYSKNDWRLAWFRPCFDEINGKISTCLANSPYIPDGAKHQGLELAKWDGSLGDNYSDNIPYFRVPEMVLIQAEARLHTTGPSAAIERLNFLRSHRGLDDLSASVNTTDEVMHEILIARRREYIGEGQRYWDLKRLGMDIRKAPETLDDVGVNEVPYQAFIILNDIPSDVIALSEENAPDSAVIKQNPGYSN